MKDKKKVYKLLPYPPYDVEAIQGWLQEMADQGWHLEKDGYFMGGMSFEKGVKKQVRYRLEASLNGTGMWTENNGEPNEEALELNQMYGWEYVSKCRDFYIYRCEDEKVRELNTDPMVQELALKEVCKRQYSSFFSIVFWFVIYQFVWIKTSIFLTMIQVGTGFFLFGEGIVFWIVFTSLKEILHLRVLRKKLKNGEFFLIDKEHKKKYHVIETFVQIGMLIIWCFILFTHGNYFFINKSAMQLSENSEVPFATMIDFVQDENVIYQEKFSDLGMNGIESWNDWLANVNINWSEHAQIKLSDNKVVEGGLNIKYHELNNSWLANRVAKEYVQTDKKQDDFELVECPDFDVDFAMTYMNSLHFQTVVLQKGNKVIHATFYQTSPSYQLEFEEWVRVLAGSLSE